MKTILGKVFEFLGNVFGIITAVIADAQSTGSDGATKRAFAIQKCKETLADLGISCPVSSTIEDWLLGWAVDYAVTEAKKSGFFTDTSNSGTASTAATATPAVSQ